MQKKVEYAFEKMNKDVAKSKHSNTFYWDAKNIRVITNSEFGDVTNEQGNIQSLELPITASNPSNKNLNVAFPITDSYIIHSEKIDEKLILFTTNNEVDCIWLVEETAPDTYETTLLYIDQLGFNYDTVIESVGINENEFSQKVYWVDGVNEIRFINIKDSDYLNKEISEISVNPRATLLDPQIDGYSSGGSHKSGVIQYAYNVYNQYGAETKVSGLSELVALYNGDSGNPLDVAIDKSPNVKLTGIPSNFEYIKVYSIYYSSLSQTPKISLIYEAENISQTLEITDTNDIIQEVSLDEFNIIGNQSIIPRHITNKDGHLFFGDYKTKKFDIEYDARVYGLLKTGASTSLTHSTNKYPNISVNNTNISTVQIPFDHDAIPSNKLAIYTKSGSVGASGPNADLFVRYKNKSLDELDSKSSNTSLKRGETYRIGAVFYNDRDEESFVKWVSDVRIPAAGEPGYENIINGNNAKLAYIQVNFKNLPSEVKSYRLVRVRRLEKDKTVQAQGFINPTKINYDSFSSIGSFNADYPTLMQPDNFQRHLTKDDTDPDINLVVSSFLTAKDAVRGEKFQKPFNMFDTNTEEVLLYDKITDQTFNGDVGTPSKNYLNFYSIDLFYEQLNKNYGESVKSRFIGLNRLNNKTNRAGFYTSYIQKTGIDNFDIELDIEERNIFSNTTGFENEEFLFQVNPLVGSDIVGIFLEKSFQEFNIDEIDKNYFNVIAPTIFKFEVVEDGITLEINRWEYKKLFNKAIYKEILYFPSLPDITLANDSLVPTFINTSGSPYILQDILVSENTPFNPSANTKNISVNYTPFLEIGEDTKFKFKTGNHLVIASFDWYDNLKPYFDNLNNTFTQFTTSFTDSLTGQTTTTTRYYHFIPLIELYYDNQTQYGGKNYNDRQANTYIPFSKKVKSNTPIVESIYGDTYIDNISLLRTTEADGNYEGTLTDIISYVGETSVNNSLRYDTLRSEVGVNTISFENSFLYNDVYQQENDLIKSISKPFNFNEIQNFRSEIVASPKKQLGEFIDNWTKISINDRITLDTKYGAITGFSKLNDTLFSFQRNAIAYIAVNPRVYVPGSDGVSTQLGSGKLIERYDYVTTKSGTLNSQSIVSTEAGIFYYDLLNYSINRLTKQNEEISLTKGLYNYVKDFSLKYFNELNNKQLVSSFYNNDKEEIYFTFRTSEDKFTVTYNLLSDGFISFYDFYPKVYFNINNKMFTSISKENKADTVEDGVSNTSISLWEHNKGDFNSFYGVHKPSSFTLIINEFPNNDKIIDNLTFIQDTKQITNTGIEEASTIGFNSIEVSNPYQTTGEVPLIFNKNIRRKFRVYGVIIPREAGTRNRIRSQYAFIKLKFDYPANNYKFVCQNVNVSYTIN